MPGVMKRWNGSEWVPHVLGGSAAWVRDTEANLVAANNVYELDTMILTTDTDVIAVGDGVTAYSNLPKYSADGTPDDYALGPTSGNQAGITGGGEVDITGLTINFDVGDTPKWVVLVVPWMTPTALDGSGHAKCQVKITDNANTLMAVGPLGASHVSISAAGPIVVEEITTPGNYTRKGRFHVPANSGTWTLFHGAAFQSRLYSTNRPPLGA